MFDNQTFELHGRTFTFKTEVDECHGEPWIENDGHGVVSEWTRRAKRPGERVLASDHGSYRYYDFQESMKIALRDGWGYGGASEGATRKQITALAVEADFERLRRWCADQWCWIGVIVTDELTGEDSSLWGIESDAGDIDEIAFDLANDMFPLAEAHEAAALELATD
jgi:hypothetical protein